MAAMTIQSNIKQNTKDFGEYGLFMGGLDVALKNIDQFDPLRVGYSRIFILRLPRFMELMDSDMSKRFKHLVEFGFTRISGISDTTLDTEDITGGYTGAKFQVPSITKSDTEGVNISVYEFSGSPIRQYIDTWMTGISDPLTGHAHYHGMMSETCQFKASNHIMECIYVSTDPTGHEDGIEYACMFSNMMPKSVKKSHFEYESGSHPAVSVDLEFTATRYESPQINQVAYALIKKYKVLRDYLDYNSGWGINSSGNNGQTAINSMANYNLKDGNAKWPTHVGPTYTTTTPASSL